MGHSSVFMGCTKGLLMFTFIITHHKGPQGCKYMAFKVGRCTQILKRQAL